jgi:hypothetical protein
MQITRAELYQKVCSLPLSKVAPQFGMSGTALAATCKKHRIPYPGSGHWTRISLHLASELPSLPDGEDEVITITPVTSKPKTVKSPTADKPPIVKVPVKAAHRERHPILVGVEPGFRKTREVKSGEFLRPYKRILPDVISSGPLLPQAIALANALYITLEKRGYRVQIASADAKLSRIAIKEQELAHKDRKYGRYSTSSIWAPDRPTITYIGTVPIGIAITEMTERVTMRYINGDYHRDDSKVVRSAKPWQIERSWTTEQDLPCGRFRIVAYSPKTGVDWSATWQDTETQPLSTLTSQIVDKLEWSKDELQRLMTAADEVAAQRQREWDEQWERYRREEDKRQVAKALAESQQQLAEIMDKWAKAVAVERFFTEAEMRLAQIDDERRQHLEERLSLARLMVGALDPLDFISSWIAPDERYRSRYAESPEAG